MIVTTEMQRILDELVKVEARQLSRLVHLPSNDMGNELIKLYYKQDNSRTRELILCFMIKAGVVWQRKLCLNDTAPIVSSKGLFASLEDYLGLLAANDDVGDLLVNG